MREEFIYAPPLPDDAPLRLHLAGVSHCDGSYRIARGVQPLWVLEHVEKGTGVLRVGAREFRPGPGSFYIAPAWREHSYAADAADPWTKHWMNVSGPLAGELLRLYGLEQAWFFPAGRPGTREAGRALLRALAAMRRARPQDTHRLAARALLEIVMALSGGGGAEPEKRDPRAASLRAFLLASVTRPAPSLREMAARANLSPAQTIRVFRQEYGVAPYDFLLGQKIAMAKEMLRASRAPLKDVAATLGFADAYYFARVFKKKTGAAPGAFRRLPADAPAEPPARQGRPAPAARGDVR